MRAEVISPQAPAARRLIASSTRIPRIPRIPRSARHAALCLFIASLAAGTAYADGRVSGRITATNGVPLASVQVVLIPEKAGTTRITSKTNKKGDYFFGLVPAGRYSLVVEGTPLVPHSIKLHVKDNEKHQDVVNYQGAPPDKPQAFDVDIKLDVTYDLVLGDADKTPASLAKREAEVQSETQQVPALLQSGDYQGALTRIDEALKARPGDPGLHYMRGYALFRLKRFDDAKAVETKALELNPEQVGAHFVLGGVLSEQGNKKEALSEFERELAGNTDMIGKINSYINIGLIHRELGNKDQAIAAFEKVLELDQKQPEAYSYLADLYLASGKADKAAEIQARSRALGLEDPKAIFNIGANYWNNKDYEHAEASFRRAVELDPGFALAWKSLGYALVNLGKTPEAVTALNKYVELSPAAEDSKEIKSLIDALGK